MTAVTVAADWIAFGPDHRRSVAHRVLSLPCSVGCALAVRRQLGVDLDPDRVEPGATGGVGLAGRANVLGERVDAGRRAGPLLYAFGEGRLVRTWARGRHCAYGQQ